MRYASRNRRGDGVKQQKALKRRDGMQDGVQDGVHRATHAVSFGDCDAAGILFYPHHFRFMDATFQHWLRSRGTSQADLRERLEAVGTGLVDASGAFRGPVHDGDALSHEMRVEEWGERTFRLAYAASVEDRLVFEGRETRGLFRRVDGRLGLMPLTALRDILERAP